MDLLPALCLLDQLRADCVSLLTLAPGRLLLGAARVRNALPMSDAFEGAPGSGQMRSRIRYLLALPIFYRFVLVPRRGQARCHE